MLGSVTEPALRLVAHDRNVADATMLIGADAGQRTAAKTIVGRTLSVAIVISRLEARR